MPTGKVEPTAKTPRQDPARALLRRAQRLRAARKFVASAAAYRELIRRYPTSAQARMGLVSLGIILLGPLKKPAQALNTFDRYLAGARRGILAQEALYGRARALRALGRQRKEVAALREFLRRFPKALQSRYARRRLRQLTPPGPKPRSTTQQESRP